MMEFILHFQITLLRISRLIKNDQINKNYGMVVQVNNRGQPDELCHYHHKHGT